MNKKINITHEWEKPEIEVTVGTAYNVTFDARIGGAKNTTINIGQRIKQWVSRQKRQYNRSFANRFGDDYGKYTPDHERLQADERWQRYWDNRQ